MKSKPKRRGQVAKLMDEMAAYRSQLATEAAAHAQTRRSCETFISRCRTLERECQTLRRLALVARLNVNDLGCMLSSLETIRTAQSEINTRLTAIRALFDDPKPETQVTNERNPSPVDP